MKAGRLVIYDCGRNIQNSTSYPNMTKKLFVYLSYFIVSVNIKAPRPSICYGLSLGLAIYYLIAPELIVQHSAFCCEKLIGIILFEIYCLIKEIVIVFLQAYILHVDRWCSRCLLKSCCRDYCFSQNFCWILHDSVF